MLYPIVYYVYDNRTQYDKPLYIVYDRDQIIKINKVLFADENPDWIFVSTRRLHPWNPNESFGHKKTAKKKR